MEIRPFRGWRYAVGHDRDVSRYIAPPYDVLSGEDKQALLAGCDKNIVAVDLPHVPPAEAGADQEYRDAADLLNEWKSTAALGQDSEPAVYVYEQAFTWAGRDYTRRALICGVRATKLGRDVIPHERTFAGPKADRLKLTEQTRMQISPVFGFFEEPEGVVGEALSLAADAAPDLQGRLRDVAERLWVLTDGRVIDDIATALRDVPVFIADGHHRYGTALEYVRALGRAGQIDDDHEANFVMFALVAGRDPGLLILPTHRIVRGLRPDFSVDRLVDRAKEFAWQRCSVDMVDLQDAGAFLRRYGSGAMALMGANPAEIWIARLADPQAMALAAADQIEPWRRLDVAILHKLIIDQALEPWRTDDLFIDYTPDARSVLAACNSGRAQLGICLQATPIEAVGTIARAGASMPHKSTYFYPKLATGMVLKGLE